MPLPKHIFEHLKKHARVKLSGLPGGLSRQQRNLLIGEPELEGILDYTEEPTSNNGGYKHLSVADSSQEGVGTTRYIDSQPPLPGKLSPKVSAVSTTPPTSTIAGNMLKMFEGLCDSRWGLPKEKRILLVERMSDIALGSDTLKDTAIRAFLALVEAEKVDLAAIKVLIDGYSASTTAQKEKVVPVDSLNLSVESRRDILKAMRAGSQNNEKTPQIAQKSA